MKISTNLLCWSLISAAMICAGINAHAAVGASTPFINYEAEDGKLGGGAVIVSVTSAPTTPYSSPELEASGHAFVALTTTGHSVTWTNTSGQNFTAINLRCCIPDAPAGGGISNTINLYVNGQFRQAFSVNSYQNYCYEGTNYNSQADKNPADGNPRGFWNDTHAFIVGNPVAPGDWITFQKDSTNSAAFYYVDVADLENPPAPLTRPANALSITDSPYNAVSNNPAIDNTTVINNCFRDAQLQGKIAWIPPGTFYFSAIQGGLSASGITIQGAGPWYSTLYRVTPSNNSQGVANMVETTSTTMRDLALDCNAFSRAGNNNNGAVNFSGNNWLVDNVWIQHVTSAFWCSGNGGTARNCRVLSVWSDGGNFNNVEGSAGIGMNLTYSNNFVRGTGDDAMAINSVNYNVNGNNTYYYTTMSNIAYVNNTAVAAWGGKNMAIYGGINQTVTNNYLHDTARYIGLGVGKFGVNGSDLYSARVLGNVVLRCGGNGYGQQQPAMMIGNGGDGQSVGMIANVYCASNIVTGAIYSGIGFTSCTNVVLQYNTVINPGLDGIVIGGGSLGSGVTGHAIINSNTVTGLNSGRVALTNNVTGFAAIIPVMAASYSSASGVVAEPCAEGNQDIGSIGNGDWSAYSGKNLNGVNTFVARVASARAGGNIEIRLDSSSGTLIGTCPVSNTGGWQTYQNVYCPLTNAAGTHTVYLVYTGSSGNLFSVQLFGIFAAPPVTSHQLIVGNTYALKSLVNGKYATAPNNGSNSLIAASAAIGTAEQFQIYDAGGGNIGLLSLVNTQYVCAENNGSSPLIANRASVGSWETFAEFDAGNGNIALRAQNNGKFVTAPNSGNNPLIASSSSIGAAESFDVEFVSGVAPSAPANVRTTVDNGRVTLTWNASDGATSYNVKRATSSSGPYVTNNVTGVSYADSGLVNGTTYYYLVSAKNPAGESANSSQVIAIPGSLDRTDWIASSSTSGSDAPGNALDGNLSTRWSTGTSQVNGQWFQVDLGSAAAFYRIILNDSASPNDYPRGYQVIVSQDGVNWGSSIASGAGSSTITTISFTPQVARYIRITQTGSAPGTYWSIHEMFVLETNPPVPLGLVGQALSSSQITLSWAASASAAGYNLKRATAVGGPYSVVATNAGTTAYLDGNLSSGFTYYYMVSATNSFGESAYSSPVGVQLIATSPPTVSFVASGSQMELNWPADHIGWQLQAQTNNSGVGLSSNWVNVPNSTATNRIVWPVNSTNGSVFFRLNYPY
jgi:hypothetical protein